MNPNEYILTAQIALNSNRIRDRFPGGFSPNEMFLIKKQLICGQVFIGNTSELPESFPGHIDLLEPLPGHFDLPIKIQFIPGEPRNSIKILSFYDKIDPSDYDYDIPERVRGEEVAIKEDYQPVFSGRFTIETLRSFAEKEGAVRLSFPTNPEVIKAFYWQEGSAADRKELCSIIKNSLTQSEVIEDFVKAIEIDDNHDYVSDIQAKLTPSLYGFFSRMAHQWYSKPAVAITPEIQAAFSELHPYQRKLVFNCMTILRDLSSQKADKPDKQAGPQ